MSEVINKLRRIDAGRTQEVPELKDPVSAGTEKESNNTIIINKNTFFVVGGLLVILTALSMALSVRAIMQVHRGNKENLKLAGIIMNQKNGMRDIESIFEEIGTHQNELFRGVLRDVNVLSRETRRNARELREIVTANEKLQTQVSDLQVTHKGLLNKYIDLNVQVKDLDVLKTGLIRQSKEINVLSGHLR
ncbi:MAG: hypothetical protein KAJ18_05790 [Candidatus Omnitrophica bacterium]|nr:hypothetical protein [Candidatus Omnitrophota bacterium]